MNHEAHIPTIGGFNVLTFSDSVLLAPKVYASKLTQVGTNSPTEVVIKDEIGMGGWTRFAQGFYANIPSVAIDSSKTVVLGSVTFGVTGTENMYSLYMYEAFGFVSVNSALFESAGAGNPVQRVLEDDRLVDTPIKVELYPYDATLPPTVEDRFNVILENLDTIQVNIWSKIIIRDSGTVTEVDGAKYRRTLDFNASSKLINS